MPFAKLVEKSPAIDSFIQSITSGLNSDYVNENFPNSESIEKWASSITSALGNKNVQTSIEDLFQLKQDKAKTPFKKYEKDVNSLVDAISGSIPEITSDMMKASLGIDRELTNMEAHYTKVSDEVGKEFADNLSISDLELASILCEAFLASIIACFNSSAFFISFSDIISEANSKSLIERLSAKYFSPTGAEDATNFLENYSKATRYLTEDSSGVKNFLTEISPR